MGILLRKTFDTFRIFRFKARHPLGVTPNRRAPFLFAACGRIGRGAASWLGIALPKRIPDDGGGIAPRQRV